MADTALLRTALVTLAIRFAAAIFFHDASSISIHPPKISSTSAFGFSMGYMNNTIVVGAPTLAKFGMVFACDVSHLYEDHKNEMTCSNVPIKPYMTDKNIAQTPHFGASIATTMDQCLTCAPLWSTNKPKKDLYGKCAFWKNDNGLVFSYVNDNYDIYWKLDVNGKASDFESKYIIGGTGWSTLIDEENQIFMIIKTSLEGDIIYGSLKYDYDESMKNPIKTKSTVMETELGSRIPSFFNFGFGHAIGKFFSNKTVYAFSMESEYLYYMVEFFEYSESYGIRSINPDFAGGGLTTIQSETPGTKFGSVMAAGDLNKDGLSELLVGAPLHTLDDCVECGALHVYVGGEYKAMYSRNWLWIVGAKEFGRFASTIAVKDIDGDGIPELAVGAPYEDAGLGAVYIISGNEIYVRLRGPKETKPLQLSDLKYTQRIQKKTFDNLGFSLQFIPDIDSNGCGELVAGAPGSGKALLLKSLQTISVKITSTLIGAKIVREQDTNFKVEVCAVVDYPKSLNNIVARLQVKNNIIGDRATIVEKKIFELDISSNSSNTKTFCEKVVVDLKIEENASYVFISEASLLTDYFINSKDFNISWAVDSPNSNLYSSLSVSRHCSGDDCMPKLSLSSISWSYSKGNNNTYILGSSDSETASIAVSNDGKSSYLDSCVFVSVSGSQLSHTTDCVSYKDAYKCYWPKPLKRNAKHIINLSLIMEPINTLQKLVIEAKLLEDCNNDEVFKDPQAFVVNYVFNTEGVEVSSVDVKKQVPDKQIDNENNYITEDQEFLITNTGNMTWNKVQMTVSAKRSRFIDKFKVMDSVSCSQAHTDEKFINLCNVDIMPDSKRKVIVTTYILKEDIPKYLIDKKLTVTSQIELHLNPTDVTLSRSITSVLIINKEVTVGQDKTLIAIIAGCVGIIVLIVIVAVLYKIGFFKRKQKQRLHVLRESVKQRNSRRNTHVSSAAEEQGIDYMEMTEEDEDAFGEEPLPKSKTDDAVKVETKAEVHKRDSDHDHD